MTLVYLAGAWLAGVAGAALGGPALWFCALAVALAGVTVAVRRRSVRSAIVALLALALLLAGGYRYNTLLPPEEPTGIATHNDGEAMRFRALVSGEPEVRNGTQRLRLSVREVFTNGAWRPSSGGVLMRAALFPEHRYGDLLELEGELETPPSFVEFDYRDYLAQRGVASLAHYPSARTIATGQGNDALATLYESRDGLSGSLERALPEPQAALAEGILLGKRGSIPADLVADMNATGTSHLIAISGQNVPLPTVATSPSVPTIRSG